MSISSISASASSVQYPIMVNGYLVYNAAGAQLAEQGLSPNSNQFPKTSNSTTAIKQTTATSSPFKVTQAPQSKNISVATQITADSNPSGSTASSGTNYSGYNQSGSSVGFGSSALRGSVLNLYA